MGKMLAEYLDLSAVGRFWVVARFLRLETFFFSVDMFINDIVCYKQQLSDFSIPLVLPLVGDLYQVRTNATQQYRKMVSEVWGGLPGATREHSTIFVLGRGY